MLKSLTVSNFKAFKEPVTIDFSTTGNYTFNTEAVKDGIVKTAVMYGKNASGKSSLGLAIFDIVGTLTDNVAKPLPDETSNSIKRFNAAYNAGEAVNWNMTPEQVRDALSAASASQHHKDNPYSTLVSIWSAVFEPNSRKVTYYFREDYTKGFEVTF